MGKEGGAGAVAAAAGKAGCRVDWRGRRRLSGWGVVAVGQFLRHAFVEGTTRGWVTTRSASRLPVRAGVAFVVDWKPCRMCTCALWGVVGGGLGDLLASWRMAGSIMEVAWSTGAPRSIPERCPLAGTAFHSCDCEAQAYGGIVPFVLWHGLRGGTGDLVLPVGALVLEAPLLGVADDGKYRRYATLPKLQEF